MTIIDRSRGESAAFGSNRVQLLKNYQKFHREATNHSQKQFWQVRINRLLEIEND